MIQKGLWQDATLRNLIALLEPDERVRALLLKGSYANSTLQPDTWSDIDVTLVVADGAFHMYFPATSWLASPDEIYTFSQSSDELTSTTRVCFTDFRRIDFSFVQESNFPKVVLYSSAVRTLFSRSSLVDEALIHAHLQPPPVQPPTAERCEDMINQFWFKGMLTTSKVMRNDLLIATHLALGMQQDVCVLAMMLRDRETGTRHHRTGGSGNAFIEQLNIVQHPYTAMGILACVKQCALLFDTLAAQWSSEYQEHRHPLLAWIDYAQETLATV